MACWQHETEETVSIEYYLNIAKDRFTLEFRYPTGDKDHELVILIVLADKEPLELYREFSDCLFHEEKTSWCMDNDL